MKKSISAVEEGNYLTIRDFTSAFNYFVGGNPNIYKLLQINYNSELSWHEFVYNSEFYSIKMDIAKDSIINCTMKRYIKNKEEKKEMDTINFDYDFAISEFIRFYYMKTIFSELNESSEFDSIITKKKRILIK